MSEKKSKTRIGVIGGGASGMTAAIFASACPNTEVIVFEAKDVPGKKINGTGNGKCNFTNDKMGIEYYRGNDPDFAAFALDRFDNNGVKDFFNSIGIRPKEKNGGYIYPNSEEASSVSAALKLTCEAQKVRFVFDKVTKVVKEKDHFKINGICFDKVILACGSFANMKDVSSFNGYDLAGSLGHRITPLYPSLCQIRCKGNFFKTINGVRTEASIKIYINGKMTAAEEGELLFTDYGISGIPAFQLSRYCSEAAGSSKKAKICVNFMPGMNDEEVLAELNKRLKNLSQNGRSAEEAMLGLLNHKLNYVLLNLSGIDPVGKIGNISDDKIKALRDKMTRLETEVTGTNDFSFAQVVAGGVDTSEIDNKTMESLKVPGLYFAGEIVDIDGTCGGYNLQWAWSSGAIAGLSAAGAGLPEDISGFITGRLS
jgi:predicted Rossmann fold flavoprotein